MPASRYIRNARDALNGRHTQTVEPCFASFLQRKRCSKREGCSNGSSRALPVLCSASAALNGRHSQTVEPCFASLLQRKRCSKRGGCSNGLSRASHAPCSASAALNDVTKLTHLQLYIDPSSSGFRWISIRLARLPRSFNSLSTSRAFGIRIKPSCSLCLSPSESRHCL